MDLRDKGDNSSTSWEERIGQQMRERERDHEINSFPVGAGTTTSSSTSSGNQLLQYERNLNFATVAMDDGEYGFPKKKTIRDPLSHRIIEKRRRDRMNNCLADLARLLPQASLRKGRGRIEKTEIVELAIKHLKHLQTHPCPHGDSCELNPMKPSGTARKPSSGPRIGLPIIPQSTSISIPCASSGSQIRPQTSIPPTSPEPFKLGFQECLNEAIHFLLESKSMIMMVNNNTENCTKLCRNLVQHLNQHVERIFRENDCKNRKLLNGFPSQGSDSTNEFNQKLCSDNSMSFGCRTTRASSPGSDYNNGANDGESRHLISGDNSSSHSQYFNDHERNALDCDVDNNSCSSTPLSIEVSDVMSSDGRNTCNGHSANLLTVPQMSWEKRSPTTRSPGCQTARTSASNCRSSDECHEILSPTSHRYKFKNNIKQRFTADTRTKTEPDTESNSSFSKLDHHSQPCDDRARDFAENEPEISRENRDNLVSSPGSEGMPEMSTCRNAFIPRVSVVDLASLAECDEPEITVNPPRSTARCVPAFVLHDNGSFYIPLTLDRSVISDEAFLEDFDENLHCNGSALPLHPVTISVCYSTALGKDNNKQCPVPRNLVTEKKRKNSNLPVSPMVLTRDPANNVIEIINEIPKPDTNFIMNRFEQSQIEANRQLLSYRHCPDSAVGINYRNFGVNHIFSGFPKCDSTRQSITSIDNTGSQLSDTNESSESMLLRKDPSKSAFVGYKPWRCHADRSPIPAPADLSSKRHSSTIFSVEQLEVPNIKNRKLTPTDFHPRILSNGPAHASVVQHKLQIPKDT